MVENERQRSQKRRNAAEQSKMAPDNDAFSAQIAAK